MSMMTIARIGNIVTNMSTERLFTAMADALPKQQPTGKPKSDACKHMLWMHGMSLHAAGY